jgi:hypothetical protein
MSIRSDIPGKIPKAAFKHLGDHFYPLHVGGCFMRAEMKSWLFVSEDFLKEMSKFDVIVMTGNAIVQGIHP